jgi:hypothetical protein
MYALVETKTKDKSHKEIKCMQSILKYTFIKSYKTFLLVVGSTIFVAFVSISLFLALNHRINSGKYLISCLKNNGI